MKNWVWVLVGSIALALSLVLPSLSPLASPPALVNSESDNVGALADSYSSMLESQAAMLESQAARGSAPKQGDVPSVPPPSGRALDEWRARFGASSFHPSTAFRHAPLAVTVDKLVRNRFLNPTDGGLTDAEIATLQAIVQGYHEVFRRLENEKGAIRAEVLMSAHRSGGLTELSALKGDLDQVTMATIQAKAEGVAGQAERAARTSELIKEALMRTKGFEAALTTPAGDVFFASAGVVDAAMPQHLEFERFLQGEFLAAVCNFFLSCGYIDAQARDAVLASYFARR